MAYLLPGSAQQEQIASRARKMHMERSEAEAIVRRYNSEMIVFRDAANKSRDPDHLREFQASEKRATHANKRLAEILDFHRRNGEPMGDQHPDVVEAKKRRQATGE